jgi:uncharacterized protein (TIGR00297 family)
MIVIWSFKNFVPFRMRASRAAPLPTPRTSHTFRRVIAPLAVASLIAVAAHRFGLLTWSGAVAAALVGALSLHAGLSAAILLLFFFVSSISLSRWRASDRDRLVRPIVGKSGPRDAAQVFANGGLFALAAFMATRGVPTPWLALAAGAIAAMTADTWSTEVGTVLGGTPRVITSGHEVAPGTSGGITIAGTIAGVLGAVSAALMVKVVGWRLSIPAIIAGGIVGFLVDSLLGSAVQERRWCDRCASATERRVHSCGTTTGHRGGIRGCNNDIVNLLSSIAGAVVTWALA